jgi:CubicO group peptidase (beta-lactamase class C family)
MKQIISLLSLLLILTSAKAQDVNQIIEKQANSILKNKEITSVSIGVFKDGQTFIGHFGTLEKGNNIPPTDETLYEIASVTKTFTGYLAAKAVLENRINLDDDIRIYLEGEYKNLEFEGKPITIQHLLTHTSSLPQFMSSKMAEVFEKLSPEAPKQILELEQNLSKKGFFEKLSAFKLTESPGTKYVYSNAGAELMGYILTNLYGASFDELLKESFLDELGMNNTAINLNAHQNENLSKGYWFKNDELSPNQLNPLWGTGSGLKSTIPDLMKYIELNLDATNPIIQESHKELYKEGKTLWVAYFWRVYKDKYGTSFNHHGATTGNQNWLYIFPKYNLGISIIVNQSDNKTPNILSSSAQSILKKVIR